MQIIQAYKGKIELTQSQKNSLFAQAKEMKAQNYSVMFVECVVCSVSGVETLVYTAYNPINDMSRTAIVGKRGGVSCNGKTGYSIELGNALEMVIQQIELHKAYTVTI